jgi:hypothetical protein
MYESSKRDPAASRVPPQSKPIDRSPTGATAFWAPPGVEVSTIFADPLGGSESGCYGPFKWGSLTIPGNCPLSELIL